MLERCHAETIALHLCMFPVMYKNIVISIIMPNKRLLSLFTTLVCCEGQSNLCASYIPSLHISNDMWGDTFFAAYRKYFGAFISFFMFLVVRCYKMSPHATWQCFTFCNCINEGISSSDAPFRLTRLSSSASSCTSLYGCIKLPNKKETRLIRLSWAQKSCIGLACSRIYVGNRVSFVTQDNNS